MRTRQNADAHQRINVRREMRRDYLGCCCRGDFLGFFSQAPSLRNSFVQYPADSGGLAQSGAVSDSLESASPASVMVMASNSSGRRSKATGTHALPDNLRTRDDGRFARERSSICCSNRRCCRCSRSCSRNSPSKNRRGETPMVNLPPALAMACPVAGSGRAGVLSHPGRPFISTSLAQPHDRGRLLAAHQLLNVVCPAL